MDALDLIKVKPLLNGHQPMASASGSYQEEHIMDWASRNAIMQFEGRCLKSSSRRCLTAPSTRPYRSLATREKSAQLCERVDACYFGIWICSRVGLSRKGPES